MTDDLNTAMAKDKKAREDRYRRNLRRGSLGLEKCRSRDTRLGEYGRYRIFDLHDNVLVEGCLPHSYSLTLDDVEALIMRGFKSRWA